MLFSCLQPHALGRQTSERGAFFELFSILETVAFCYCSLEISINLTKEPLLSCRVVFYGRLYLVCKLVYRLYQTTLFLLHLALLVHHYLSFSCFAVKCPNKNIMKLKSRSMTPKGGVRKSSIIEITR